VKPKSSLLVVNENPIHWGSFTVFVNARGEPVHPDALKSGMAVEVEAAETTGGLAALSVKLE
jgi:hypothetical protein